MKPAPILENERERLATLLQYEILDTESELAFDDLTQLASSICGCPIAVISLIDSDRQWFKSKIGLDPSVSETTREISFCGHAIHHNELFTVEDAEKDERFRDNPLVTGDLSIRFYAGAPLIAPNGQAIGALCVIDQKSKNLTETQKKALKALARQVVAQLELRKAHQNLKENFRSLQQSAEFVTESQRKIAETSRLVSLGEMSAGIAHEINNPLAVIVGRAEVLLNKLETHELSPRDFADGLNKIIATGFRISKIIKGLKTFSRDASREPIEPYDLQLLVQETLSLCAERFKSQGVEIHLELEATRIDCRSVQISQILLNLLNNAFDAVSTSDTKWVKVSALNRTDGVLLSVTDSGYGIPEHIASKVMQPFFTTKGIGQGMGMGLSISRGLAESHDGSLSIDTSSPHTKFELFIPNLPSAENRKVS